MINLNNLIHRPSLNGVDISNISPDRNLRWYDLSGAKCDYWKLKNPTWVQEGLILCSTKYLRNAMLAQEYGNGTLNKTRRSRKYCISIGVVGYPSNISSNKSYKYVVTINRKSRRNKVKDTRPSLRGVDISGTNPDIDLSHLNLSGAFCDMEKLKNPSWVQDGLIIKSGPRGGGHDAMDSAIEYFEDSGIASVAKPKYNPVDDWNYTITIELLHKGGGSD